MALFARAATRGMAALRPSGRRNPSVITVWRAFGSAATGGGPLGRNERGSQWSMATGAAIVAAAATAAATASCEDEEEEDTKVHESAASLEASRAGPAKVAASSPGQLRMQLTARHDSAEDSCR